MFAAFLVVSAKAKPGFVYTVNIGHQPLIYTNGHGGGYGGYQVEEPVQPLQYVRPTLYANNACRNNLGELVPCAFPSVAGSSVYAFNTAPDVGFVQATPGVAVVQGNEEEPSIQAPEDNAIDVRTLEKREAEADAGVVYAYPYYGYYGTYGLPYGHYGFYGYAPYGCRNAYGSIVPCAH